MMNTPTPLHERFSWLTSEIKNDENAIFAEKVLAVTQGAQTIANIMRNNLDDLAAAADGDDTQPLLSAYDIGTLAGLMIVSLGTLARDAEIRMNAIGAATLKGAKK